MSLPNPPAAGGTTYSAAQVLQMLIGPSLQMRWLFDLLNAQLGYKADLTPNLLYDSPPRIEHDSTRAIKRQLTLTMRALAGVNVLQDLVRVRYQILAPDGGWLEWVVGLFMLAPAVRAISDAYTTWSITAPDLSQLLSDDAFRLSTAAQATANHAGAVASLVAAYAGPTRLSSQIPDRGTVLPASIGWDAGASRLKAVADVLASMAYVPPWMRGTTLISYPQPDYTGLAPAVTFDEAAGQVQVFGPFEEQPDYTGAYNQFLVTGQDPRRQAVSAYYEITNPASPIAVQNWHPRLRKIDDSKLADSNACMVRAKTEAQLAARGLTMLTVGTVPFPFFEDLDVVRVAYKATDEGTVAANYVVIAGTHVCREGEKTIGRLQKIIPI